MGHYVLNAASFEDKGRAFAGQGSIQSVPLFSWGAKVKRPSLDNGGDQFPQTEDGLHQFEPPTFFLRARRWHWEMPGIRARLT